MEFQNEWPSKGFSSQVFEIPCTHLINTKVLSNTVDFSMKLFRTQSKTALGSKRCNLNNAIGQLDAVKKQNEKSLCLCNHKMSLYKKE